MDYEKKYKDALERAEKALEVFGTDKCEGARQIFSLFPELKESEDEKIRKELIDYINRLTASPNNIEKYNTWIAWLEKQGEHKPADEEMKELLRTEYEKGRADAIAEMQKPACSEDETSIAINNPKAYRIGFADGEAHAKEEIVTTWSEDDETYLNTTFAYLKDAKEFKKTAENCINWLKSLKERCTWKPNEWQLKAIKWILDGDNPENWTVTLAKLYNDLKKL